MNDRQAKLLLESVSQLSSKVDTLIELFTPPDRNIGVPEICTILNMKKTAVYDRISRGKIPAHKVNGKFMISFNLLQQLLPQIT